MPQTDCQICVPVPLPIESWRGESLLDQSMPCLVVALSWADERREPSRLTYPEYMSAVCLMLGSLVHDFVDHELSQISTGAGGIEHNLG